MDDLDERTMARRVDRTSPADRTLSGRYRLVRPIGTGGMGVVWEARDLRLGRRVAVKMLTNQPPGAPLDRAATARLINEARVASLVAHPGVISVFDVGIDGGRPFVVMELVEGPTLASVLEDGPVGDGEATRIGARIAEALAAIHSRGIVHGDVTPANVIVAPDGGPKLTDLGTASLTPRDGDEPRGESGSDGPMARSERYGTLPYVAPEVMAGADPTPAADVYSLGVLLAELCADRRGAGSADVADIAQRARATDPSARPAAAAMASTLAAAARRGHGGDAPRVLVGPVPRSPGGLGNVSPGPATVPLRSAGASATTRLRPAGASATTRLRPVGGTSTARLEPIDATPPGRSVPMRGSEAGRRGRRPSAGALVTAIVGPLAVGAVALAIVGAAGRGASDQAPPLRSTPPAATSHASPSPSVTAIAVPPPTHDPPAGKDHDHHKHHGHGHGHDEGD
jgi:hypothetical protein